MTSDLKIPSETDDHVRRQSSIEILSPKQEQIPAKIKKRFKSDLPVNYSPPDGEWGWLVVIAAAISILVTFDVLNEFIILIRQRSEMIGIDDGFNFKLTAIKNTQHVAAACTAFFSGPIFRYFTYRQISFAGAILIFFGMALTVYVETFDHYLLTLSIMCGIGGSLIFLSSYIAVNTYFKDKRRQAIALMYSIVGLGQIFLPYITTSLIDAYSFTWTLLLFVMFSLHNFLSSLIYQPVKFHAKKNRDIELDEIRPLKFVFGSRQIEKLNALETSSNNSSNDLNNLYRLSIPSAYPLKVPKNSFASFEPLRSRSIPKIILPDETEYIESPQDIMESSPSAPTSPPIDKKNLSIFKKIITFLDLDLLGDLSFVNLVLGLALINFIESKFFLTSESIWKWDLLMRAALFLVPKNVTCSCKLVLCGAVLGMCLGKTFIELSDNYTLVMAWLGWMGLCTGVRVVFWMLILPSYIPLERLPAAMGLQHVVSVIVLIICELIGGLIPDVSKSLQLICTNIVCVCIALAWLGGDFMKRRKKITIPPVK